MKCQPTCFRKQKTGGELDDHKDEKDHKGSHSKMTRPAEGKVENQNGKIKKTEEEKVENKELQSERQETIKRDKERIEPKTETDDGNPHVLDASKQEAEHEDKKGKDQEGMQSGMITETERKEENQKGQSNGKFEGTEEESDGRENNPPSFSREVTESPKLKTEKKTRAPGRKISEIRKKGSRSDPPRGVKVECKERQEEGLETDKVADTTETQKKSKDSCTQQQLDVKEETTEQPQVFKFPTERAE